MDVASHWLSKLLNNPHSEFSYGPSLHITQKFVLLQLPCTQKWGQLLEYLYCHDLISGRHLLAMLLCFVIMVGYLKNFHICLKDFHDVSIALWNIISMSTDMVSHWQPFVSSFEMNSSETVIKCTPCTYDRKNFFNSLGLVCWTSESISVGYYHRQDNRGIFS